MTHVELGKLFYSRDLSKQISQSRNGVLLITGNLIDSDIVVTAYPNTSTDFNMGTMGVAQSE